MVLLIDNYDSFVHNLARYLEELGQPTTVRRNREVTVSDILRLDPLAVVISPGPCDPPRAGVSMSVVRALSGRVPLLGICLGHQAIAAALGGRVVRAPRPVHGFASLIDHDGRGVFRGVPSPFLGGRYHSLAVPEAGLPDCLEVCAAAREPEGTRVVMALRHRSHPTVGLQFHPESVLTEHGHLFLSNFLALAAEFRGAGRSPEAWAAREETPERAPRTKGEGVSAEGPDGEEAVLLSSAALSSAAGAARAGMPGTAGKTG